MNAFAVEQASRLLHALLRTRPATPPQAAKPAHVLIVKPASLGDVLMSTAFIAALRASLPQATITVLVTSWAKEALANSPHCDRIINSGSVGFPSAYGLRAYLACVSRLRREGFTHSFVLDRSPLMALLPRLAGIPWRAGLNSAHRGVALHVGVPCPEDRHEAEVYLDVLRAAGLPVKEPRLHFRPARPDSEAAQGLLADSAIENRKPLIAIHPGGGRNPGQDLVSKRWTGKGFSALAEGLAVSHNACTVLVGGFDDQALAGAIEHALTTPVLNLAGKLTLPQLGAVIQQCDLFIGNDSAPMHLAAAVNTPVVALFGPTSPERYGPYGVASEVVHFRPNDSEDTDPSEVEAATAAAARLLGQ